MLKPPTEEEIFRFVLKTHEKDRVELKYQDISGTWHKKIPPNPYAHGHFKAIMIILHKLIPGSDFPAKSTELLTNVVHSESALWWLRDIHKEMTEPLTKHILLQDDINTPKPFDVGKYRYWQLAKSPDPSEIPNTMCAWLKDYTAFHHKIKDKVKNPYGVSKDLYQEILEKSKQVNVFFSTVQPMSCLNQRMGRLLENAFRLKWYLNWKV